MADSILENNTVYKLSIETTEQDDIARILCSEEMGLALWSLDSYLRRKYKHVDAKHGDLSDETDEIRDKLHEILTEYGLSLDKLTH